MEKQQNNPAIVMLSARYTLYNLMLILGVGITALHGQPATSLHVERSAKSYQKSVIAHPEMQMTELKRLVPGIIYDLRYATTNNFMHRRMYARNTTTAFLRKPAAEALLKVQNELNNEGLGIKIFDAYRPYSVSEKFWELVKDERYVANPARGSNHNRGTAVDLTLVDLETGKELDMGTGFDNFTDSAHHTFTGLPTAVTANRQKLKSVMRRFGFMALTTEWWHYTYESPLKFEVLDISFKKLAK